MAFSQFDTKANYQNIFGQSESGQQKDSISILQENYTRHISLYKRICLNRHEKYAWLTFSEWPSKCFAPDTKYIKFIVSIQVLFRKDLSPLHSSIFEIKLKINFWRNSA